MTKTFDGIVHFDDIVIYACCYKDIWNSYHFHGEDVFVEIVLYLFISYVDEKLFERVVMSIFETKNIQNSNLEVFTSVQRNNENEKKKPQKKPGNSNI